MKKTILIVDDDEAILTSFAHILERNGYATDTAGNGKEALTKAKNREYNVVLLDIRLPDMDGTELLAKAKSYLRRTVKIMVTGYPSLESGVRALDEGADAYLIKPVKAEELLTVVGDKLAGDVTRFVQKRIRN